MPVAIPDDLYEDMRRLGLSPSELLQVAIQAEVERADALRETDTFLDELVDEVGPPTGEEQARAAEIARRIRARPR